MSELLNNQDESCKKNKAYFSNSIKKLNNQFKVLINNEKTSDKILNEKMLICEEMWFNKYQTQLKNITETIPKVQVVKYLKTERMVKQFYKINDTTFDGKLIIDEKHKKLMISHFYEKPIVKLKNKDVIMKIDEENVVTKINEENNPKNKKIMFPFIDFEELNKK